MKKTVFIKNALILTAASLVLRFGGIIFKVWLAKIIGSEGMGLYQLVFSVYLLVSAFAGQGISTAVTRLTAEEIDVCGKKGAKRIVVRAIELTLIIAFVSQFAIFVGAKWVATAFLGDARAEIALKIMSFSLPFMGICSCLRGYFLAKRKATPGAVSQIFEQSARILFAVFLLKKFAKKGVAVCCGAVLAGDAAAEMTACIILAVLCAFDIKKMPEKGTPIKHTVRRTIHIALPITAGKYLNTALRTVENLLVPRNLSKFNPSGSALSEFGMIKGMALPILLFPSTLLNSVSLLLIPEISEAAKKGRNGLVKTTTRKIIRLTAIISFIITAAFFVSGEKIGTAIYQNRNVGLLIKYLSPIVPLMYLDSVTDGILKGLDQQGFASRTAVADSVLRIILVLLLLPFTGLWGFIIIMYISNFLTGFLNLGRLIKCSKVKFCPINDCFLPLTAAFISALSADSVLKFFGIPNVVYIILFSIISSGLYLLILQLTDTVTLEEIRCFFSDIKSSKT